MSRRDLLVAFILVSAYLRAQTVDFTIPAEVCRGESVVFANITAGDDPFWTFCTSVDGVHSADSYGSIAPSLSGLSIIEDNGSWFGLAVTRDNGLYRLEFGGDPSNANYSVVSLGNPGNLLNGPEWIHVIKADDKWYGLVTNADHDLVRLVWSSLETAPQASKLNLSGTGKFSTPTQVEIQKDGSNYVALVANSGTDQLALVNFGSSLANNPQSGDIILSSVFPGPLNMYGVTATYTCGEWQIYTAVTDKLFRIDAGPTLFNAIDPGEITDVSGFVPVPIGSYTRLKTIVEGPDTHLYFSSYTTNRFASLTWRGQTSTYQFTDFSSLASFTQLYSLEAYHDGNQHGLYVGSFGGGEITHVDIEPDCPVSASTSFDQVPKNISYAEAGTYPISLTMTTAPGIRCSVVKNIVVKPLTAPDINFESTNICVNHDVSFQAFSSVGGILGYQWQFGDGFMSNDAAPIHQYAAAGAFNVKLVVTAGNTCTNNSESGLTIYQEPIADFDVPPGLICTNNEFIFSNQTTDVFDGHLAYTWKINGSTVSNEPDLHYSFAEVGDYTVSLSATIPGCTSDAIQNVNNVQAGPNVDFSIVGKCDNEILNFISQVTGDISGYLWDFGIGNTYTSPNVQQQLAAGPYDISLNVQGVNGCVTNETKPLVVYSSPSASFVLDVPPFSCAGTPSQFHDTTPSPIDSNLQSWAWTFGDGTTGAGKNPTHVYSIAGPYNVGLTVTSDKGCLNTTTNQITISPSPVVSFVNDPACVTKQTQFQGTSASATKAWSWKIGNATYQVQNPTHVFASAGEYKVEMSATANNNCVGAVSKKILVPIAPTLDFTTTNPCAGQAVTMSATATGTSDHVSSYQWNFGGGSVQTGQNIEHTFSAPGLQQVTLTSKHQSGCSYFILKSITINPVPVAKFDPTTTYGSSPLTVSFTNKSTGAAAYKWQFDTGAVVTDVSPTYVFNELGVYEVSLEATSAQGCSTNTSGSVHVIVPHTDLAIDELALSTDVQGLTRGLLTISNNSNYPISGFDLVMESGSGILITENVSETIEPFAQLTVVSKNALTFQQGGAGYICVSIRVSGDEDVNNDRQCRTTSEESVFFSPYPNPAQDALMIQYIAAGADELDVRIVNETGAVAYSVRLSVDFGLSLFNLDVSNLGPGLYVVKIASSSGVTTQRVVIK